MTGLDEYRDERWIGKLLHQDDNACIRGSIIWLELYHNDVYQGEMKKGNNVKSLPSIQRRLDLT